MTITPDEAKQALASLTPEALTRYKELAPHILLYTADTSPDTSPEAPPPVTTAPVSEITLTSLAEQLKALQDKLVDTKSPVTPPVTPPAQPGVPISGGTPAIPQTMADVHNLLSQYPL